MGSQLAYLFVLIPILPFLIICGVFYYRSKKAEYPSKTIPQSGTREYDEWVTKLKPEISLRLIQEQDQSRGRHVWFSRHIFRGSWKHWIIIIDDVKYELRQNHETERFYVNIVPCKLDHEQRDAARASKHFPEYCDHHVCLIGWTRLTAAEVKTCALEVGEGWDYNRFTKNCQHYLKLLADKILVEEKAADYPWFLENNPTDYLSSRAPLPSVEILQMKEHTSRQSHMATQTRFGLAMASGDWGGGHHC